jgi:hypothetical protein
LHRFVTGVTRPAASARRLPLLLPEVSMPRRLSLAALALLCCAAPQPAAAQNFLMNSAETINRKNFKIALFPIALFGRNDAPDRWGGGTRFGYGFTDNFDVEGKLAFFDGLTLYGLDAEFWLVKGEVDFSVQVGGHGASVDDGFDSKALDLSALVSGHVAERLELYGGMSVSFESLDDVEDSGFTRAYLVPGFEYKISEELDLVGEFGIGLNDDSPHYLGLGIAVYLR